MNNHPIADLFSNGNSLFEAQQLTCLLSSTRENYVNHILIYRHSIRRSITLYCVRCLPKHTWINDNNRFIGRENENE